MKALMSKHKQDIGSAIEKYDEEKVNFIQKIEKLEVIQSKWAQASVNTFFDKWYYISKVRVIRKRNRYEKVEECNKAEREFFDIQMR